MVIKEKSRDTDAGYKHSMHVLVEVCGAPGSTLKEALRAVLLPFKDQLRKPNFAGFTDEDLKGHDAPVIGVDLQPLCGYTPIAMAFSCKSPGDPEPCVQARHFFCRGDYHEFPIGCGIDNPVPFSPEPAASSQHRLEDLSDAQAAELLRHSSCSIPTHYMTPVQPLFKSKGEMETQRYRAPACPRSGVSGGPPGAQGGPSKSGQCLSLPMWFRSYLDQTPGYSERRESAYAYARSLPDLDLPCVKNPALFQCAHIDKMAVPCPTRLSKKISELHKHVGNGVIVAWHPEMPECVLARCTECKELDLTNEHCERVERKNGYPTQWIKFDQLGFESLVSVQGQLALFFVRVKLALFKMNPTLLSGRQKVQRLISDQLQKKRDSDEKKKDSKVRSKKN